VPRGRLTTSLWDRLDLGHAFDDHGDHALDAARRRAGACARDFARPQATGAERVAHLDLARATRTSVLSAVTSTSNSVP
jgi:hypothetical protein